MSAPAVPSQFSGGRWTYWGRAGDVLVTLCPGFVARVLARSYVVAILRGSVSYTHLTLPTICSV
eukprot:5815005-Alexandrium_andersonii.AAC.1